MINIKQRLCWCCFYSYTIKANI